MPHLGFPKELFPFGMLGLVRCICGLLRSILMPSPGMVKGLGTEIHEKQVPYSVSSLCLH